jgi:U3 small nucleolar RNA-associated protein 22
LANPSSKIPDAERALIKQARVAVPFPRPRPPKKANYKMQYLKPSGINVVGSYQLKTLTKTNEPLAVDLLVTMPAVRAHFT